MKVNAFLVLGLLFYSCSSKSMDEASTKKYQGVNYSKAPGTVVNHMSASEKHYLDSLCIVIMPNGDYLVSHDVNSHDREVPLYDKTIILKSIDKGKTWTKISELKTQHWSTLFYYNDALYIIGTIAKWSDAAIQKSLDGGYT